jgi:hypothetical protein
MKLGEIDWFMILIIPITLLILGGTITYSEQQQRVLFQQTYNKNLECRQALKNQSEGRINNICGSVPVIGDFVK